MLLTRQLVSAIPMHLTQPRMLPRLSNIWTAGSYSLSQPPPAINIWLPAGNVRWWWTGSYLTRPESSNGCYNIYRGMDSYATSKWDHMGVPTGHGVLERPGRHTGRAGTILIVNVDRRSISTWLGHGGYLSEWHANDSSILRYWGRKRRFGWLVNLQANRGCIYLCVQAKPPVMIRAGNTYIQARKHTCVSVRFLYSAHDVGAEEP